jgi:hypothetical protein
VLEEDLMFDAMLAEMMRQQRGRNAPPAFRHGQVTAVRSTPAGVQVAALFGEAWLRRLDGPAPAVGDHVVIVQQGTDAFVLGRFAA